VKEKWRKICKICDKIVSLDESGLVNPEQLIDVLKSSGVRENLRAIKSRAKKKRKKLTLQELESKLFHCVQSNPDNKLSELFFEAISTKVEHKVLLIAGLLGRGKSSTAQYLTSGINRDEAGVFQTDAIGRKGGGVTRHFQIGHFPYLGKDGDKYVTVIDTPGGNDESLPNFNMFKVLQVTLKKIRYIDGILVVISPQDVMRRMESFNTYLQEFSLMLQQQQIIANVSIVITRAHVLIPDFYPSLERLEVALKEACFIPLNNAFGEGECKYFRLSTQANDYIEFPDSKSQSLKNAYSLYKAYENAPPICCQKLESLEIRVRRLIKDQISLEAKKKEIEDEYKRESAKHASTQNILEKTRQQLLEERDELTRIDEELKRKREDLNITDQQLSLTSEKLFVQMSITDSQNEDLAQKESMIDKLRKHLEEEKALRTELAGRVITLESETQVNRYYDDEDMHAPSTAASSDYGPSASCRCTIS